MVVDGDPLGFGLSISDRAGWAVCVTCPTAAPAGDPREPPAVGCDLELVEPRTPGFVRDFFTAAEQGWIASRAAGDERDMSANLVWSAKVECAEGVDHRTAAGHPFAGGNSGRAARRRLG